MRSVVLFSVLALVAPALAGCSGTGCGARPRAGCPCGSENGTDGICTPDNVHPLACRAGTWVEIAGAGNACEDAGPSDTGP